MFELFSLLFGLLCDEYQKPSPKPLPAPDPPEQE